MEGNQGNINLSVLSALNVFFYGQGIPKKEAH